MKAMLAAVALSASLVTGALAQTVVLQPEQETVIREYVTTHKVKPVEVTDVEVSVGAVLPEAVELHAIDVPDVEYQYVVVGERTVLVEPETRKIIHIIE